MAKVLIYTVSLSLSAAFFSSAYKSIPSASCTHIPQARQLSAPKHLKSDKFFCMLREEEGISDAIDRLSIEKTNKWNRIVDYIAVEISLADNALYLGENLVDKPSEDQKEKFDILKLDKRHIFAARSTMKTADKNPDSLMQFDVIIVDKFSGRMIRTSTTASFQEILFPQGYLSSSSEYFECDEKVALNID